MLCIFFYTKIIPLVTKHRRSRFFDWSYSRRGSPALSQCLVQSSQETERWKSSSNVWKQEDLPNKQGRKKGCRGCAGGVQDEVGKAKQWNSGVGYSLSLLLQLVWWSLLQWVCWDSQSALQTSQQQEICTGIASSTTNMHPWLVWSTATAQCHTGTVLMAESEKCPFNLKVEEAQRGYPMAFAQDWCHSPGSRPRPQIKNALPGKIFYLFCNIAGLSLLSSLKNVISRAQRAPCHNL